MKKILLCMVLAGLMMPAVAQEKGSVSKAYVAHVKEVLDRGTSTAEMLPMNPGTSLVYVAGGWNDFGVSKSYDRQTQGSVYPMIQIHSDGFIGATWTNNDNPVFPGSGTPTRGIGYSYSKDGGVTWSEQENRVSGLPLYWPSYVQWGKDGEAILGRSYDSFNHQGIDIKDGLVLLTREKKGEGEWNIIPVPYPDGYIPTFTNFMAWARMASSGDENQYLHIMSPLRTPQSDHPTFYYRTQDGGLSWDVAGELISDLVGHEWDKHMDGYTDGINFAVRGNTIACCFMSMGSDGYVLRSYDNGDTWESIKFFESPVRMSLYPSDFADTAYVPVQGCVALDNDGKIHLAFSVVMTMNSETTLSYFSGALTSFLSYWNEDMLPIDGSVSFVKNVVDGMLWEEYLDDDQTTNEHLYVNSKIPRLPVIGFYTPISDANKFSIDFDIMREWGGSSYGPSGGFSFPQMAFDRNNKLHLVYLGFLDGGSQEGRWIRQLYYTTTEDKGETWSETEYLINHLDLIDKEFAYLALAGLGDNRMYLMVQTDIYAGVYEGYVNTGSDHGPVDNIFYYFNIDNVPTEESTPEIEKTSIAMTLIPNPAVSGQTKVIFEGKGNITVYNMLGQTVYHAENVVREKEISLSNLTTGVYFVTVRSGNAMATQKLVVK